MTRKVERFWQALEHVPDLAAVPAEWRALLGDEYALVSRFLLPTQRLARSVKPSGHGRACVHEIKRWKGEFLSVCPDGCETATLSRDEVTIHRLDTAGMGREIAQAFGCEARSAEPAPHITCVWRIGDYAPLSGFRFPVCLTLTGEPDALRAALDALTARGEPFILFAPTRSALTQICADLLTRTKSCFLPLAELLGQDNDDRLTLMDGLTADGVLAEFHALHVPEPKEGDGMAFFPTPPGARWKDVSIRFTDRHTVCVTVGSVSGTFHFAQMGMVNRKNATPTKQWLLLEAFAKGCGYLDWDSSDADRRNQKRRERLAKDLGRFFRIDGDPLVSEGNGWRARFAVSVTE